MGNKTKVKTFRIEEDVYSDFEKACKSKFTTPSREIQIFIHQRTKELESKPISLQEYSTKRK
jgi:hypothetical protein